MVEGTPISRVVAVYVPVAIQLHSALWLRSIPRTHYDESPQFTTHPANTAQHKLFAQAVLGEGQLHAQAVVGEGHRKRVSTHTSKCFNVIPYHRTTRGALKAALVPGVQSGLEPAHPEADCPSRNFARKGKSWLLAHISPNSELHKNKRFMATPATMSSWRAAFPSSRQTKTDSERIMFK